MIVSLDMLNASCAALTVLVTPLDDCILYCLSTAEILISECIELIQKDDISTTLSSDAARAMYVSTKDEICRAPMSEESGPGTCSDVVSEYQLERNAILALCGSDSGLTLDVI